MNTVLADPCDHQLLGSDRRQGVCHISDVLPIVLARIAAMAQTDTGGYPESVDVAMDATPVSTTV